MDGRKVRGEKAVASPRKGRAAAFPEASLFDRARMERGIRLFLEGIGPVVPSSVLEKAPRLVTDAWTRDLLAGYRQGGEPLVSPLSGEAPDSLVVIRGIRFVSICRHHLLPFQGTASIGYLPGRRLAGFSAVARLVDHLASRLQIQEDLSEQIAARLEESLGPRGVACLLEATHQCMTCRGAKQPETRVVTLRLRGIFETEPERRREVLALLQAPPVPVERNG